MNKERTVEEIIAVVDALLEAGKDAEAEKELIAAIAEYAGSDLGDMIGRSVLLNELGGFYRKRGQFIEGEKAFLEAKDLLEKARECGGGNMAVNYATTLNNLAGLYRMDGRLQQAIDMFDAAIQEYESCEGQVAPDFLASAYNNKGLVFLNLRETNQAKAMFLRAKGILEEGGNFAFAMGATLSNMGFAAVAEKEYSAAAEYFRSAKMLFEEAGALEMAQSSAELLSRLEGRG